MAKMVKKSTRIHENAGLITGLRIWHCCSGGSDSIPGAGTSICHRKGPKIKNKQTINQPI